jgi:hypothetical protein
MKLTRGGYERRTPRDTRRTDGPGSPAGAAPLRETIQAVRRATSSSGLCDAFRDPLARDGVELAWPPEVRDARRE